MWRGGRRIAAFAALVVQLGVVVAGVASVCHEGPHTHAGLPAPDCAMHHGQPAGESASSGHHHHGGAPAAGDVATVRCRCASGPVKFLTGEIAILFGAAPVPAPMSAVMTVSRSAEAVLDLNLPPVAPPPRHLLS